MCSSCSRVQKGMGSNNIGPLVQNRRRFQRGGGAVLTTPQYNFYYNPYKSSGRGIGAVFMKFFKAVSPMLMNGLKSVGKEALSAGSDILNNTSGRPTRELFRSRGKQAFENLKRKAEQKMEKVMEGSGKTSIKRRRIVKPNQSLLAIKPINNRKKRGSKKRKQNKGNKKIKNKDIFD